MRDQCADIAVTDADKDQVEETVVIELGELGDMCSVRATPSTPYTHIHTHIIHIQRKQFNTHSPTHRATRILTLNKAKNEPKNATHEQIIIIHLLLRND